VIGTWMPEGMRGHNFARHFSLTGFERYLDAVTLFRREAQQHLFTAEAFEQLAQCDPWKMAGEHLVSRHAGHAGHNGDSTRGSGPAAWLSALQQFDLAGYLPLDILTKVDRMSMAHSLEARVPLLDHKLVEFAARIPPELSLRRGTTKYLFKRAMRGILPETIIDRPKHGFGVPLGCWFRGRLSDVLQELLLSETVRRRGIFNPAYVEQLLRRHQRGRPLDLQLWTLLSFELWCRTFLDRGVHRPLAALPRAVFPV
jgi:asparagine synthase (glutamine-hydrolysing)